MADRLTQLQDALDQLATQFYASLRYLSLHAPPRIPTSLQPPTDPAAPPPRPDSPTTFLAAQKELARDILLQEAQIEVLISSLPGIERGEAEQVKRLQELEAELKEAESEREQAVREMGGWLRGVEEVIEGVRRGGSK